MPTNTQRENPDQPWREAPRRARGIEEHQGIRARNMIPARFSIRFHRKETVPIRRPLAVPIINAYENTGRIHRRIAWLLLRRIGENIGIIDGE